MFNPDPVHTNPKCNKSSAQTTATATSTDVDSEPKKVKQSGQTQIGQQHHLKIDLMKSRLDIDHIKAKNELEIKLLSVQLQKEEELAKLHISAKQDQLARIQKYEEQQAQIEFNVFVCLSRKKLRDAKVDQLELNHLVPGLASVDSFPEQLSEYFKDVDSESISLKALIDFLARDFPPLFYDSPDLLLTISPFHDDLTVNSLETMLAGKDLYSFLEPFRLPLKDRRRALREIKSRQSAAEKSSIQSIAIQKTVIEKGHLDIAEALVKAQIDLSDEELDGGELIECCKNNDVAGLRCCLALGLDVDCKHLQSGTGLHWASLNGNTEIVKLLLAAGANVNMLSNNHSTPLYTASMKGHFDIVKMLLQQGAQKEHETKEGKTAYSIAEEKGFQAICDLLK